MQQECNFNYITNGWARLAITCEWASPLLPELPKQIPNNSEALVKFELIFTI